MRLRTLSLIYLVCTSLAIAMPFVSRAVDVRLRAAKPVNSEPPLEPAPAIVSAELDPRDALPACLSPAGTEYYGGRGWFYAKSGERNYFYKDTDENFHSCSISVDGNVYITTFGPQEGSLRAYSSSGRLRWNIPLPGSYGPQFSAPAISRTGTLYLSVRNEDAMFLTAMGEDGKKRWELPLESGPKEHWGSIPDALLPPIVNPDGTVYAISSGRSPDLVAVTQGGRRLWSTTLPAPPSDIVVGPDRGTLVSIPVACGTDSNGRPIVESSCVLAYAPDGRKRWQFSSGFQGPIGGVVVAADGTVYVASGALYALDPSGRQKWAFRSELTYTRDDYFNQPLLLGQDGTIYAESYQRQLYAITSQGRKKWHLDKTQVTNVSVGNENVLSNDGTLFLLVGRMQVGSGLATDGWSSQNHDNRNSRSMEAQ